MIKYKKQCISQHSHPCSSQPFMIEATPESCADKRVTMIVRLPIDFGPPRVWNCANSRLHKKIEKIKGLDRHFSLTFSYNNDLPQVYCVTGKNCRSEVCQFHVNSTIYSNCTPPTPPPQPPLHSINDAFNAATLPIVIFTTIAAVLFIIILGIVIFKKIFKAHGAVVKHKCNTLIAFSNENAKHAETVLRFASVLQKDYGVNVRLDLYECEKIYSNPAGWLDEVMTSCEKVLVIWSPGAEAKWRNHEQISDRHDMFIPVLRHLNHDLVMRTNLKKYVIGYFDYCDKKMIVKTFQNQRIPCFKLMDQFDNLCKFLSDSKIVKSQEQKEIKKSGDLVSLEFSLAEILAKPRLNWFKPK